MKVIAPNKNILIFGTDHFGLMTYYAYQNDPYKQFEVESFVDVGIEKGTVLEGLKVFDINDIDTAFIQQKSIVSIIIAVQYIETVALFDIIIRLLELNVEIKIVPPIDQCENGIISLDQIKKLQIDDLLLRKPKYELNAELLNAYENQIILITGAAGSIGRELVNQLTEFNYKGLILLDSAESALFEIQQELIQKGVKNFDAVVANICDYGRMDYLFNHFKPKIVIHAAAYKHVPLMEEHPYEAVKVNVIGTKHVADLSVKHGVDKFILISTDKAVNPTNVMGATKRLAELYINGLENTGQTKFMITRFGNVMGSNGSVVPLFEKQIKAGGPVKVTSEDIERFFMSISEACQLILEAGAMGLGGEIFVFEMGKPVKIHDLAELMIKLSGKQVYIKISGLRPGEKVVEELMATNESAKPTYHQKIKIAQSKPRSTGDMQTKLLELCNKASKLQNLELVALMKDIIPEYISNNSKFGVLDNPKK